MQNFEGIVFIWIKTYKEIFKSGISVSLNSIAFDFSKTRKLSRKVGNNMALLDFLKGYTSVSLCSRYSLCSHFVHVAQKSVTCCTKNHVVSTKKMFHMEDVSQCYTENEYMLTRNSFCCKWIYVVLVKKVLFCTKDTLMS